MQTYAHFAVLCQCTVVYMKDLHYPNQPITFTLHGKQTRSMDLIILAAQLRQMDFTKRLTVLDLSRNLITPSGVSTLVEEIVIQIPSLTELNLDENPLLSDHGVKAIIPYLDRSNIQILRLAHCGLGDRTTRYFRESKIPKKLRRLDLSGNLLSDDGAAHLVRTLKHAKMSKSKVGAEIS